MLTICILCLNTNHKFVKHRTWNQFPDCIMVDGSVDLEHEVIPGPSARNAAKLPCMASTSSPQSMDQGHETRKHAVKTLISACNLIQHTIYFTPYILLPQGQALCTWPRCYCPYPRLLCHRGCWELQHNRLKGQHNYCILLFT